MTNTIEDAITAMAQAIGEGVADGLRILNARLKVDELLLAALMAKANFSKQEAEEVLKDASKQIDASSVDEKFKANFRQAIEDFSKYQQW